VKVAVLDVQSLPSDLERSKSQIIPANSRTIFQHE